MIEYAGAIFLVVGFLAVLKVSGLVEKSKRVIGISKQAVEELRSTELTEDAKELAMQDHAKRLFGFFFLITFGGVAAVFLPYAIIWGLDTLDLISLDGVMIVALSWPFIIGTTVVIVVALAVNRKR